MKETLKQQSVHLLCREKQQRNTVDIYKPKQQVIWKLQLANDRNVQVNVLNWFRSRFIPLYETVLFRKVRSFGCRFLSWLGFVMAAAFMDHKLKSILCLGETQPESNKERKKQLDIHDRHTL